MNDLQTKLDYADSVADWFLELSENSIKSGNLEEGAKYSHIAASILSRQNRNLVSYRLEKNLCLIAGRLHEYNAQPLVMSLKDDQEKCCLHVLDEALAAGGLTLMAIRWILNDNRGWKHNVVLLAQEASIPDELFQASNQTGGTVYKFEPSASFLSRAVWLRSLAQKTASMVILHISVSDVICGIAFGVNDGPPVLIVNHAAHIFWTGTSIADLVINCRGSELERLWTEKFRNSLSALVPIPLPNLPIRSSGVISDKDKQEAKKAIGLPEDSIVILTVGASFKFLLMDGLDFVKTFESILSQVPKAILVVVGAQPHDRWTAASKRTDDRIKVMGGISQSKLAQFREAADIYAESFPFGSTTSLLETALYWVPAVFAPSQCPPPYGTDGIAVDNLTKRPASVEDYKNEIIALCNNPDERRKLGRKIGASVVQHHTGMGWVKHLENALGRLPENHKTHLNLLSIRTPENIHEYWANFVAKHNYGYEETFEHSVTRALLNGLKPYLTESLKQTFNNFSIVRANRSIPVFILRLYFDVLTHIFPNAWSTVIFRILSFFCRGNLAKRLYEKADNLIRRKGELPSWYGEYRNIRN